MTTSRPLPSFSVAARRALFTSSGTQGPARRVRRAAVIAFLAVPCAACAAGGPSGYAGTGSLSLSGATTQPLLASHLAELTDCPTLHELHGVFSSFSILALGQGCVMDGFATGDSFHADRGTVCTLDFGGSPHKITVTDVSFQYGITSYASGRTYSDHDQIQILLGGDDATAGVHALYRFTGSSIGDTAPASTCSTERLKRVSHVPDAFQVETDSSEPPHPIVP